MKVTVNRPTEIEIDKIRMCLAVRYGEEDIPNDFPGRDGDMLELVVNLETGVIDDWPAGRSFDVYMKVCDQGSYYLMRGDKEVARLEEEYVPNGVVPGEYGDYVELAIDESGRITNWPKNPDVSVFFNE